MPFDLSPCGLRPFYLDPGHRERLRAEAALPGGTGLSVPWEYQGTECLQGRWQHAFLHPGHPELDGKRVQIWIPAPQGWTPIEDASTLCQALAFLAQDDGPSAARNTHPRPAKRQTRPRPTAIMPTAIT